MVLMTIMDWIALGWALGFLSYPVAMVILKIIENAVDNKSK